MLKPLSHIALCTTVAITSALAQYRTFEAEYSLVEKKYIAERSISIKGKVNALVEKLKEHEVETTFEKLLNGKNEDYEFTGLFIDQANSRQNCVYCPTMKMFVVMPNGAKTSVTFDPENVLNQRPTFEQSETERMRKEIHIKQALANKYDQMPNKARKISNLLDAQSKNQLYIKEEVNDLFGIKSKSTLTKILKYSKKISVKFDIKGNIDHPMDFLLTYHLSTAKQNRDITVRVNENALNLLNN